MGQLYRVLNGCSEGFYVGLSDEEKERHLKEFGYTFMYSLSGSRMAVYYDSSANKINPETIRVLVDDKTYKTATQEEFDKDLERCEYALGCHEKKPKWMIHAERYYKEQANT